jgi:hypothetical protein
MSLALPRIPQYTGPCFPEKGPTASSVLSELASEIIRDTITQPPDTLRTLDVERTVRQHLMATAPAFPTVARLHAAKAADVAAVKYQVGAVIPGLQRLPSGDAEDPRPNTPPGFVLIPGTVLYYQEIRLQADIQGEPRWLGCRPSVLPDCPVPRARYGSEGITVTVSVIQPAKDIAPSAESVKIAARQALDDMRRWCDALTNDIEAAVTSVASDLRRVIARQLGDEDFGQQIGDIS